MKKTLAVSVVAIMALTAMLPAVSATAPQKAIADPPYEGGKTPGPALVHGSLTHALDPPGGGGATNNPVKIAAMWETSGTPLDDDPCKDGTQVDPPMEYQGWTEVCFFVAVFDLDNFYGQGINDINTVKIELFHPENAGDDNCVEPGDGSLKVDLVLDPMGNTEGLNAFLAAHSVEDVNNHIICYYNEFDYSSVYHEWNESHIIIYKICYDMYYHQPAGWYHAIATATDNGATSDTQENWWEYVEGLGYELDFDTIDWGTLTNVNQWYWKDGDWEFNAGDGYPTIRNIGNWDVKIGVAFDNWNFGTSTYSSGTHPDVMFDVRIGDKNPAAAKYNESWYEHTGQEMWPDGTIYSPIPIDNKVCSDPYAYSGPRDNVLLLCNTTKINFGIYIYKFTHGEDSYGGDILLYALDPEYYPDPHTPCGP